MKNANKLITPVIVVLGFTIGCFVGKRLCQNETQDEVIRYLTSKPQGGRFTEWLYDLLLCEDTNRVARIDLEMQLCLRSLSLAFAGLHNTNQDSFIESVVVHDEWIEKQLSMPFMTAMHFAKDGPPGFGSDTNGPVSHAQGL